MSKADSARQRVWRAADKLAAKGVKPTGRELARQLEGIPANTINQALTLWWSRFLKGTAQQSSKGDEISALEARIRELETELEKERAVSSALKEIIRDKIR